MRRPRGSSSHPTYCRPIWWGAVGYHAQELKFEPNLGSIFNNLILADEINRTPAKV